MLLVVKIPWWRNNYPLNCLANLTKTRIHKSVSELTPKCWPFSSVLQNARILSTSIMSEHLWVILAIYTVLPSVHSISHGIKYRELHAAHTPKKAGGCGGRWGLKIIKLSVVAQQSVWDYEYNLMLMKEQHQRGIFCLMIRAQTYFSHRHFALQFVTNSVFLCTTEKKREK